MNPISNTQNPTPNTIRPKILIVDDKVENLISLEKIFADLDVEFVRANSANVGLKKALESEFAIALVDVQMPGMDGFEMVELMRQERKTRHLPVIFLSAIYKEEYHQIKGIETGAVDFLTKPIIPKILIGKVRVFLDLHKNKMSLEEEIKQRKLLEKELLEANEILEISVEKRTAELFEANEALKVEMEERKKIDDELEKHRDHLEQLVGERTIELDKRILEVEQLNRGMVNLLEDLRISNESLEIMTQKLADTNTELEAFAYSVSHDLRAPLRAINGFSEMLVEDYGDKFEPEGQRQLDIIQESARNMGQLIDDLLTFSRLGRKGMTFSNIDMSVIAKEVFEQLQFAEGERSVQLKLNALPPANCDLAMIREVFSNFLSNALKYTRPNEAAVIEIAGRTDGEELIYSVKDNGVGFDMKYADKLFRVFQRLHGPEEFEGTGIGLALVQRIISRHGGRVGGEGKVDQGATFWFTLPRGGSDQ